MIIFLIVFLVEVAMAIFGLLFFFLGRYPLAAGRMSYGWGARIAGMLMALTWPVGFGLGRMLVGAGVITPNTSISEIFGTALILDMVCIGGCFAVSYIVAEATYVPYWIYRRRYDAREREPDDDEGLTSEQMRAKLERKMEKRRLKEESRRKSIEEEAAWQEKRARSTGTSRGTHPSGASPPPLPRASRVTDDDDRFQASRPRQPRFDGDDYENEVRRRPSGNGAVWAVVAGIAVLFVIVIGLMCFALLSDKAPKEPVVVANPPPVDPKPPVQDQVKPPPQDGKKPPKIDPPVDPPPKEPPPKVDPLEGLKVAKWLGKAEEIVPNIVWAADGASFYFVEKKGKLRRFTLTPEGFSQRKAIQIEGPAAWLALSAEGLVVTTANGGLVADPETLETIREFKMPPGNRIVSAPSLSVGFASSAKEDIGGVHVIDLKKGVIVNQYVNKQLSSKTAGFARPVVTPDGKFLLGQNAGQIHRFAIDGATLSLAQSTPSIASGRDGEIQVSIDSQYVCLPTGGGNNRLPGGPELNGYWTHLFLVSDFSRVPITIQQGAYPEALTIDPKTRQIYGQDHEHQLILFDNQGRKGREFNFSKGHDAVRQYLVHPQGNRLLILTEQNLYDVRFSK